MQLYYHPISSNARRVLLAADHLDIRLDLVEVNLMSEADRRRLAEVNDNGKIPVLVDDGFILTESCAIMQYLADSKPGQTVYPRDPLARADVNRWMFWACQHFAPAISVLSWETLWKKLVTGEDADPGELARGAADLAQAAAVLDRHLAGRRWLAWDGVTLADYAVAAPLMYRERARLPLDSYPHLTEWFARIQELPAWRNSEAVW
ncbi:glutathione S-transferase [Massilia sp. WF1]|uniref:glutathione S-transferase family protein n=1 Tax=unclassified Massilia TaxID=2609279 RepID=UPI0006496270|nr:MULTISPECIES: glutathione S-transferase family protein [unclassified Massilia]ALK95932.1 glutathione S-transferase [Massilia sp. WG5]KLU37487.1 glutathione S-transferase [Massilia sp. WF1]